METAQLAEYLRPCPVERLVRVGREYDGGYVVDERSVLAADMLVSLGINDDWSFESGFRALNPCPLVAFDGTVSSRKFTRNVIKSLPRLDNPRLLYDNVRTLVGYHQFFADSAQHVEALIGMDREPEYLSLKSIFKSYVPATARNVFLKIDIERWEYRLLEDLVQVSDRVCGVAIEFHDFDLHQERVRDFLARTRLKVCHIHCNNYEPMNESATPLVIELSLTGFEVGDAADPRLPGALDMPNNRLREDYAIRFL
jgi:hypothetical protein